MKLRCSDQWCRSIFMAGVLLGVCGLVVIVIYRGVNVSLIAEEVDSIPAHGHNTHWNTELVEGHTHKLLQCSLIPRPAFLSPSPHV